MFTPTDATTRLEWKCPCCADWNTFVLHDAHVPVCPQCWSPAPDDAQTRYHRDPQHK